MELRMTSASHIQRLDGRIVGTSATRSSGLAREGSKSDQRGDRKQRGTERQAQKQLE